MLDYKARGKSPPKSILHAHVHLSPTHCRSKNQTHNTSMNYRWVHIYSWYILVHWAIYNNTTIDGGAYKQQTFISDSSGISKIKALADLVSGGDPLPSS